VPLNYVAIYSGAALEHLFLGACAIWFGSMLARFKRNLSMSKKYAAKITPGVGGSAIWVETPANDAFQAKKLIASIYAPRVWWRSPVRIS
jgi:hypothetical protein